MSVSFPLPSLATSSLPPEPLGDQGWVPSPSQFSHYPTPSGNYPLKSSHSFESRAQGRVSLTSFPFSTKIHYPPTPLRPLVVSLSHLRHLPLCLHRFLFHHWGHWMDWSLAFLLTISLLVTYASLLLVGYRSLTTKLSFPYCSILFWPLREEMFLGVVLYCALHSVTSLGVSLFLPLCLQLLALFLRFCGQPLHLHSVHKVQWGWEGSRVTNVPTWLLTEDHTILFHMIFRSKALGYLVSFVVVWFDLV